MAGRYKLVHPVDTKKRKKPPDEAEPIRDAVPEVQVDASAVEIKERAVLVPMKDKEVMQSIGLVRQYLRDTGVNANMNKFTTGLLQGKVLPYNPYPGYVRRFRRLSEKFYLRRESLSVVQRRVSQCPTFLTGTGILGGVKLSNIHIWGLQHILTSINPKMVERYRNSVLSSIVPDATIKEKCGTGSNISVMSALVGPSIFMGSLHDQFYQIDIMESILVSAADFQNAAKLFGMVVVCDLQHIHSHKAHHLLSLKIPVATTKAFTVKNIYADELERILSSEDISLRDDLAQEIGFAALKKQDANAIFLLSLDVDEDSSFQLKHVVATKSYNLMTITSQRQANGLQGPASLFISTAPYQILHEGLFLNQTEAELYVSTFKKYSSFKSPISPQVMAPVQKVWQDKIAKNQLESDALNVVHYLYLMERAQNPTKPSLAKSEDSIAIEILRLFQGTGIKLDKIAPFTLALSELASSTKSTNYPELFQEILSFYRASFEEFFDENSHEVSLALSAAKPVVMNCLEKVKQYAVKKKSHDMKMNLNFIQGYIKSLSIGLIEDAIEHCPAIRGTKSQIDDIVGISFGSNLNVDVRPNAYKYRIDSGMTNNVDQKLLDLSQCATSSRAPPNISLRVAMMQYCVDVRIDEVWQQFLETLLLVRDNLPPNPYPCLITKFRQASLKVQLFYESNTVIAKRLLVNKPKQYDGKLLLYSIPGIPAFGTLPAVSLLSVVGFRQVSTMAITAAISPPVPGSGTPAISVGSFELRCYPALSREMLFYGSATPYISSITMEEYCFIRGPKSQEHEGIVSLAKILLIHLGNLSAQGIVPLKALFSETDLLLSDIVNNSARFQSEFVSTINNQQTVMLQISIPVDWRYIIIEKVIHVYYINEMNEEVKFLSKPDILNSYRQVFFNANDAVEYAKRTVHFQKDSDLAIRKEMSRCWKECDWSGLAQCLLMNAIKKNEGESIQDEASIDVIAFCCKLFHSAYGILHYSVSASRAMTESICSSGASKHLLKTMLFGYRNVLNAALTQPSTLTTSAVDTYCQHLLQDLTACDLGSGYADISNNEKVANVLRHINSVIQCLADSLALDLVKCSSTVHAFLTDMEKQLQ